MAGWSSFNHSSCSYIDVKVEYIDECEERIKRLFDQALVVFLEEEGNKRPLPAIIGDGEKVDLFKLFVLVREREGFDSVSRKGLWELVAEKLGFDCSVSPSLKLIYSKYLDRMEKWAVEKKSRNVSWDSQGSVKKGCYGGLLHELGNGFKGLLGNGKCEKRNRDMVFGCEESGSGVNRKRLRESCDEVVEVSCVPLIVETVVCVEEEGLDLSSKKQRDLPGMLKWLTAVAISPDDPSIGVIPHFSKWKKYTGNQCWIQATRAKNALLVKRENVDQCRYQTSPLLMAHQTLHPSMYDDERERKSIGRLRYGIRPPHSSKHHSSLGCDGCSVSLNKSRSNNCRELAIIPARADLVAGTSGTTDLQVYSNAITQPKKLDIPIRHVPIGSRYQAQVDEWTGSGIDSDTKWLGTRLWPEGNEEALDNTLGNDLIGKGKPDSCSCDILRPGSVECIRFHIAEKRMELKRELGDVFLRWRFNQMGEEVCLRWTDREEKRFKDIMISDPRSFWQNTARCFGGKKREQLVSYYFNVFLINKRRYQNRVTPRHIDSDGDDEPFGCVGNGFGRDAVTTVGSETMICAQNRQCFDFE